MNKFVFNELNCTERYRASAMYTKINKYPLKRCFIPAAGCRHGFAFAQLLCQLFRKSRLGPHRLGSFNKICIVHANSNNRYLKISKANLQTEIIVFSLFYYKFTVVAYLVSGRKSSMKLKIGKPPRSYI
ncbi:hypothetical protein T11_7553 [Trichinella zimbabwensis]|uniref:Uncharacterized protein n=1 Tax=Trichinella zimbabwensis TaxID=268475 RepID=A0A0V1I5V1_9BILA|nr:hypothetical protein T11_7553 [Trichinella zimbabwensis]